jgi:hypothetical protein
MKAYRTTTQTEAERDAAKRKEVLALFKAAALKAGKGYHKHTHISYSFLTQNAKSK